jgi:capsular exopolysaccharide synthesis family protein
MTPPSTPQEPYGSYGSPPVPTRSSQKKVEQALDVLYRRRFIIIAALLLAGVYATYQALTEQTLYQSSAVVMLDLTRMPGGGTQQAAQPIGDTPFVRSERNVTTELFILNNSRALAERVNARLQALHEAGEPVTFPPRGSVGFSSASRNISSAIRLTATSPDPREAAILANVYAEEYVRQTQDASRSYLVVSREFLEAQEGRRRQELQEAEDAIEAYMRRTGSAALSTEGAGLVARIAGMEAQRDDSIIEIQMREASLAALEGQLNLITPQLAQRMASRTEPRLQQLNEEMAELETQRRQILAFDASTQQAGNARQADQLARVDRRIEQIQAEINQNTEQFVAEAMGAGGLPGSPAAVSHAVDLSRQIGQERVALNGLRARVGSMNQRLSQNQASLSQIPEQTTDVARLQRAYQHAQQTYEYVQQRLQETRIMEESEPGYARVLSRAGTGFPIGTSPWRTLGMGLLFGLLIGVAMAVVRDRLDTRLYKPDQLRAHGVGVLGVIPDLRPFLKERFGKADRAEHEGHEVATSLITLHEPLSAPSEAYRHLRTSIQFSRLDALVQTILVTSSAASDGKSTTAANLAIAMAQAHRRTLLIDADLRRPSQHTLFGLPPDKGLATVLKGEGDFRGGEPDGDVLDGWISGFRSSHHPNLYVLPAGALTGGDPSGNPSELLGSKRMREALDLLRQHFDVIIIDTPPVLAATDAVLLSTQADATVVVVRAGSTKEGDLEHGLEMLRDVGARVPGVLLNGFDITQAYGYRYSYGHYSKYGPYTKQGYDVLPNSSSQSRAS